MMAETLALAGSRLLLVEDEAIVAMMIEDQLIDLGCVVVSVVASVSEGLAAIDQKASALDAAVLDVNLGNEKVYPVAERLKERGIPFIFSTGYGLAGIAPDFSEIPALAKPFGSKALETTLVYALSAGAPKGPN